MVVSSSKGAILPTTMAQLSVANGYRTASNGTAWSYFSFVADYFDFNEFYTSSSLNTALSYLEQDKNKDGQADYYIIVSCGSGLFTTGGHYIVLSGYDGNNIKVYDPYIYNGKFTTASRKNAGVIVQGNSALVSRTNFAQYANAKNYWIFSNDNGNGTSISLYTSGQKVVVDIPVGICCYQGNYALVDDYNSQFWIHKSVITNDNRIYALGTVCYDGGSTDIVQIFSEQFWCSESNMSNPIVKENIIEANKYTLGTYITNTSLNVRNGAGTKYKILKTYKKNTVFTALEIKENWARTPSGWVCLDYARKK